MARRSTSSFAWGDQPVPNGELMANFWQGDSRGGTRAPRAGKARRRLASSAQRLRPADVTGNVWEWTSDYFAEHGASVDEPGASPCCAPQNPCVLTPMTAMTRAHRRPGSPGV